MHTRFAQFSWIIFLLSPDVPILIFCKNIQGYVSKNRLLRPNWLGYSHEKELNLWEYAPKMSFWSPCHVDNFADLSHLNQNQHQPKYLFSYSHKKYTYCYSYQGQAEGNIYQDLFWPKCVSTVPLVFQVPGEKILEGYCLLINKPCHLFLKPWWLLDHLQGSEPLYFEWGNSLAWLDFTHDWWHILTYNQGYSLCQSQAVY